MSIASSNESHLGRRLLHPACLFLAGVAAAACTSSTDAAGGLGEDAADVSATNVNVCRRGKSLPILEVDGSAQWFTTAAYDSTAGTDLRASEPFNGWEHGYSIFLSSFHEIDPAFVEACAGKLRLLPNARISLHDDVLADCKPGTEVGNTCALRDGVAVHGVGYTLQQLNGFAVTTDALRLRAGPSVSEAILETMPKGSIVLLLGEWAIDVDANDFGSVLYAGKRGWASGGWVRPMSGTAVTKDRLRLRRGASLNEPVLRVIPAGQTVHLTGWATGQFVEAEHDGLRGYVSGDWLKDPVFDDAPPVF